MLECLGTLSRDGDTEREWGHQEGMGTLSRAREPEWGWQ